MIIKSINKYARSCSMLLLIISLDLSAQDLTQKVSFDTSITTGYLANGLKYYIKPNPKPENKVELRLIINAGSILETDGQQGLAHFMEHMNFNGTKNYPKNELVDFLQSIGVQFGADLNAYTGFDETVYILPIPTDKPGNAEKGFEVLGDWAQRALLTDTDIDAERKVVLEESRMGKGAEDRMMKVYLPRLMAGSRYSSRLPIGQDEILKTFSPDTLRKFHKDWYRPNLMAVAVVGDITVAEAKAWIYKYFYDLKNPENAPERVSVDVPQFIKKDALVLTDKEATSEEFSIFFSSKKSNQILTLGDYRNAIIEQLFTSMLNNRLQALTQTSKPPFLYSYAYVGGWARGSESFQLHAASSGDMKMAINAAIGELVRVQKFGFNPSELKIASSNTMSWIENAYNERSTTESNRLVGEMVGNFLEQEPMAGIAVEFDYYRTLLPTISVQDINAMAVKLIGDNKTWFAMVKGPEDSKVKKLGYKKLIKIVNKAYKQKVVPLPEKEMAISLLSQDPIPGAIQSTAHDSILNTTTYELSNGVKVTIKSTNYKSDEIILSGSKKGGKSQYGATDVMNTQYMDEVIGSMGFGNFSPKEMQDFLAGKNASVSTYSYNTGNGLFGSSSIKDLETMLQLCYLMLTSPRKDLALYEGFLSRLQKSMEHAKSEPQNYFMDSITRFITNNHPLSKIIIPSTADLAKLNVDRILEIHNTDFGNADGFHFYVVGNVNEEIFKPLMLKYLGGLPAKGGTAAFKDNGLRNITGNNELRLQKGTEPKCLILEQYYGEMPFTTEMNEKASMIGEILSIKAIEEMRERIGGIYSGQATGIMVKEPFGKFVIGVYLPCGPESLDTLLRTLDIEIARLKTEGPSEKDLAKVKIGKIEKFKDGLQSNQNWANWLSAVYTSDMHSKWIVDYESQINSITAEDLKAAANLLLSGENHFRAILLPE